MPIIRSVPAREFATAAVQENDFNADFIVCAR